MQNNQTLRLQASVETKLAEGANPKLAIKAYSGQVVDYPGLGPMVIDLAGLSFGETVILTDHQNAVEAVVGMGTPEVRDGQLHVNATANGVTAGSKTVVGLVSATPPTPLQASVGIKMQSRKILQSGDKATVNGQVVTAGPKGLLLVSKSTLNEVSVTPLGVDGSTSVNIAASRKMIEAETQDIQLAQKQVRDELLRIELACTGLDFANDGMTSRVQELKLSAYKGEISYEGLLQGLLKIQQDDVKLSKTTGARPQGPAIHSSSRDVNDTVLEAALCLSLNMPKVEKHYKEETLDLAHKNFRHIGLQETLELAARANGYQGRGCKSDLEGVLRHCFDKSQITMSSGPSTVSLPNILGAVANKELLAGFVEEDQTWREVAVVKPVNNFHTHTSYRLLDDFEYEQVTINDGGLIPHGRIDEDQVYTRSVDTYAKMFALTRRQLVNDDLNALDDIRTRLGRGAAKKFNNLFWQTFLTEADGTSDATFRSGNSNYISGSTTNLGTDGVGLEAGVLKFWQMKSPSPEDGTPGKRIGGQPVKLIIPPELSFNADRLYQSTNLVGGTTAIPEANIHANRYRPVVVPFLSDSTFTGYSTTAWGVFRDPAQYATLVVSFLNGQQAPTVESTTADFNTLGILMRGFHDFGVDPAEIYGGVWSKGAS